MSEGRYIHLAEPHPADSLAEFAARAERAQGIPENNIRVHICVKDEADGNTFEFDSIGFTDLIRAIACLPGIKERGRVRPQGAKKC